MSSSDRERFWLFAIAVSRLPHLVREKELGGGSCLGSSHAVLVGCHDDGAAVASRMRPSRVRALEALSTAQLRLLPSRWSSERRTAPAAPNGPIDSVAVRNARDISANMRSSAGRQGTSVNSRDCSISAKPPAKTVSTARR